VGGGLSACGICDNISVKGLGGRADGSGNPGFGSTLADPADDPGLSGVGGGLSAYATCDNISVKELGGGALSGPGTFVDVGRLSFNESRRF
jgi:hypothetical protein